MIGATLERVHGRGDDLRPGHHMLMPDRLRIGTSGWHYPGGATWNGVFYPKPRPRGFDELSFYARFFDTVEVNSTFYGQPRALVSQSWVDRTPEGFLFSVKLYQQFTHPAMFARRVVHTLARDLGSGDIPIGAIDALVTANQADFDEFRRGIAPLADAGKLGPLLAQFPPSFHDSPIARAHLAFLLRAFHGYPVAVELRHRSWSDRLTETRQLLDAFGAAWVWIDEPKFEDSIRQPDPPIGSFLYARLHGRNARAWWRGSNDERYDYLYSAEELGAVAERLRGRQGAVYLNNHPHARSVVNGLALKQMMGEKIEVPLPDALRVLEPVPLGPSRST